MISLALWLIGAFFFVCILLFVVGCVGGVVDTIRAHFNRKPTTEERRRRDLGY